MNSANSVTVLPDEYEQLRKDSERMDWLERMVVEARLPLVHGSAHLFLTSPKPVEGADDEPSNIRAHIDFQMRGGQRPTGDVGGSQ